MRIACENCSAAYAIEDRLISPRGVRAQCPKCRHRQLVKRDEQTRSPNAAPAPAPVAAPAPQTPARDDSAGACRACGKRLTDAFDLALGTCDGCRSEEVAAEQSDGAPSTPSPLPDLMADLGLEDPPLEVETAPSSQPAPAASMQRPRVVAPLSAGVRSASREPEPEEPTRSLRPAVVGAVAVALVAILGVGALVLARRSGDASQPAAQEQGLPAEIKAVLPRWEMAFMDVTGDPAALLKTGRAKLEEDLPASYDEAREAFQIALLLDPRSDEAIAGYVRALAAGKGARAPQATWDEALSLIRAAEQRSGRTAEEVLAHAELLIARAPGAQRLEEARGLAEWVVDSSGDLGLKAHAQVVIGRTWQASSGALAVKHFDDALALVPGLERALYFRALAHDAAGEYSRALADLRKRVEADPLHPDANAQLARIYVEAGRNDLARSVYETILEKRPEDIRARLPLAVFQYQVEGKVSAALTELRKLAREVEHYEVGDQVRILTHLAAAERLAGRANAAVDAAQRALGIVKDAPAAHLQLLLVAVDRGLSSDAMVHLTALKGQLEDAALESLLEGRIRLIERQWPEAIAAFQRAASAERWRVQATLLSGVAAAAGGRRDDAFRYLYEVARSDPSSVDPRPAVTELYLRHRELLRGLDGRILALAEDRSDVPPHLYEGVFRFHQGDFAAADRLFRQVQDLDGRNALAYAWSALADLERGNVRRAAESAKNAETHGRQEAIAHYAAGYVALVSKQPEQAGRLLREALRLEPGFLAAEQRLAELDAQVGAVEAASERLRGIVARAPGYLPARRLLFSLAKEDGP